MGYLFLVYGKRNDSNPRSLLEMAPSETRNNYYYINYINILNFFNIT
jgi:hypothetical protein